MYSFFVTFFLQFSKIMPEFIPHLPGKSFGSKIVEYGVCEE